MIQGFWQKLPKPFFVLAPMANVTDAAFRRVIATTAKPDLMVTEFVSADGLCSAGREKLLVDFWYTEAERPIVAQIFGSRPENFYAAAQLIRELKFDGIDINMGCPDRAVERQGAGAALIKNPSRAKELIAAAQEGGGGLPVSVKTRIGFNSIEVETWIPTLLETGIAALTIHGRTRKELSKVPAHWDVIGRVAQMARAMREADRPLIIGNGDVASLDEAQEKVRIWGVDGVMIGRGIFGNPWFFDRAREIIPLERRMRTLVQHTRLFEELFIRSTLKGFDIMKKHYKAYVSGFDGAKELRVRLMEAKDADEVAEIIAEERREI